MENAGDGDRLDVSVAVFDQGALIVERLELPERSAGEIDVDITAAAICGSDLHTVLGHRSAPARTALGHEGVGRVAAIDDDVVDLRGAPLRPGDRVLFALFSACGDCDRCTAGLSMKCRSLLKYGHESVTKQPHATGTLADRVRLLPGVAVLRIPDDIDDVHVVSAGCAVATAAAVVAAAGPLASATRALVFGAGAVGAYCIAMLASLGCSVHARDPSEARLALVEEFGAQTRQHDDAPFPVVVEASGNAQAFVDAVHATALGGRLIAVGSVSPGSTTVTFDPALLVTRRLTLMGIHNYTAEEFGWGVDWLLEHGRGLGLDRLVSPPIPLFAVEKAFQEMQTGAYPRVLVQPGIGSGSE